MRDRFTRTGLLSSVAVWPCGPRQRLAWSRCRASMTTATTSRAARAHSRRLYDQLDDTIFEQVAQAADMRATSATGRQAQGKR